MKYKLTNAWEDLESLGILSKKDPQRESNTAPHEEAILDPYNARIELQNNDSETQEEDHNKWQDLKEFILKEMTTSANAGGGFPAGGPFISGQSAMLRPPNILGIKKDKKKKRKIR